MIETRPGARSGKPCFIGTRIAVHDVLDYLAAGMTPSEIAGDFPELSEQHVLAAVELAAPSEQRPATSICAVVAASGYRVKRACERNRSENAFDR